MATYKSIDANSTFPITVGGNTLMNFQRLLLYILADKTDKEIAEAYEKIVKKEFDEEWIEHYAFLAYMINLLEKTAADKNLLKEEELQETNQPGS